MLLRCSLVCCRQPSPALSIARGTVCLALSRTQVFVWLAVWLMPSFPPAPSSVRGIATKDTHITP